VKKQKIVKRLPKNSP